jgi:hypothetical protein
MKRIASISGLAFLLLTLGLALISESQESLWKGKIERKDGVTIVSNPKSPISRADTVKLEEDLSIGKAAGGSEYSFVRAWYIAVDDAGAIYVMDQGESCVKAYDEKGKYLRSIGRKGEGPGELQHPNSIHLIDGRRLVFEDFIRSLITFSTDGPFISSLSTAKLMPLNILVTPNNEIVAYMNVVSSDRKGKEIRVYDGQLQLLKTLFFIPDEALDPQIIRPFAADFHWALIQGDRLAISRHETYEIEILDLKGASNAIFKRDHDRVKIIRAEADEMTARVKKGRKVDIPEYYPAIQGISADDEGHIYVKTFEITTDGASFLHDIFDREGRYLAKVPIPRTARDLIWKNRKLYYLTEDAEGFHKIKRFRVIWQLPK